MKIFTMDSRDYVVWDVIQSDAKDQGLSVNFNKAILSEFNIFQNILKNKGLRYQDFKTVLTPQKKRFEAAFVFDTLKVEDDLYDSFVIRILLPQLYKTGNYAVFFGDFIASNELQSDIRDLFSLAFSSFDPESFQHSSQYCVLYLNNLTRTKLDGLEALFKSYEQYVGMFDLTFSSPLKTHLSKKLGQMFLVMDDKVIAMEDEAGCLYKDYGYSELGFSVYGIYDPYFNLFLSYKIEREILPQFKSDTYFSISAINPEPKDIYDFDIFIECPKFDYLMREKKDSFDRIPQNYLTLDSLSRQIKEKIANNYIYNLELNQHDTSKFNILLEFPGKSNRDPVKFEASFEYCSDKGVLRLITMY